jgi:hypothetical protein
MGSFLISLSLRFLDTNRIEALKSWYAFFVKSNEL